MHANIAQEGVIDQNIEKSLIVPTISGFPMGHVLSEPGLLAKVNLILREQYKVESIGN